MIGMSAKMKKVEFKGEVLRGRASYEIVDEIGDGLTELRGILKPFENKRVHIEVEEIEEEGDE